LRQDALDGFLGAAAALHTVARIAVMADGADLQKAVGSGDGAWFAATDARGRGRLRGAPGDREGREDREGRDGSAQANTVDADEADFVPTLYLYDNLPGGIGLAEPLWKRQAELVRGAIALIDECDCSAGCPACVGPVLSESRQDDTATTPKAHARRVLIALSVAERD
jgi:DEAD/DEAH box helicase domain-containing protein